MVAKSNDSLFPIERSDQANLDEKLPKSPLSSYEHLSKLKQFLEKQITFLDSTHHSDPNNTDINYVNEENNFGTGSGQVVGAPENTLNINSMNMNTSANTQEGGMRDITTSEQCSSSNWVVVLSKNHDNGVTIMQHPKMN